MAPPGELPAARITDNPFTLGVASGDPLSDSVLLRTRLAPQPFAEDGGLGQERVAVSWEVALDEWIVLVEQEGTATAHHPEYAHSAHVDVKGLRSDSEYYYRQRKFDLTEPARVSMDAWDGYRASRGRVMAGAKAAGISNLMVLTGDVHIGYAFDIKENLDDPASKTVSTVFTCTSVASGGNGTAKPAEWDTYMKANPHSCAPWNATSG